MTYLNDFSDRISPMLVKELRQGLRAKTFVGMFLGLQVFMGVMLLSAGSSGSATQAGSVISGVIFTFFCIAVLLVQPLRGTSALSSEIKGNTIDMMVLTRLSAWRIVAGKWVAIVSQSALLLSAIIPYLILRYFFGGMNLTGEIVLLLMIFLTSMMLTAVTIGLSGCTSVMVRFLLPVLGLPLSLWMLLMVSMRSVMGGGGSDNPVEMCALTTPESRIGVAVYALVMIYLGFTFLSWGATMIAPAAENHTVWRRWLALGLGLGLAVAGGCEWMSDWLAMVLMCLVLIPAVIIALTESAPWVETVRRPFARFGPVGRTLGWLSYPNQASGFLYAVVAGVLPLCVFVVLTGVSKKLARSDADDWVVVMSIFGGLFFPAVAQIFLQRGEGQRVAGYLLTLAGSYIALGVLSALAGAMRSTSFLWLFAWNPLVFLPIVSDSKTDDDMLLVFVTLVDISLLLILVGKALIDIRKIPAHGLQREISRNPQP